MRQVHVFPGDANHVRRHEPPTLAWFVQIDMGDPERSWVVVENEDGSLEWVAPGRVFFVDPPETTVPQLQERINRLVAGQVPEGDERVAGLLEVAADALELIANEPSIDAGQADSLRWFVTQIRKGE